MGGSKLLQGLLTYWGEPSISSWIQKVCVTKKKPQRTDEPLVSGLLEQNAGGWVLHKIGELFTALEARSWKLGSFVRVGFGETSVGSVAFGHMASRRGSE